MDFRKIIRDEMERQGVTRTRLAELAGMTLPRVSQYLNAQRDVQGGTLERIFDALELKVRAAGRGEPRPGKRG